MAFTHLQMLIGVGISLVLACHFLVVDGLSAVIIYENEMCSGAPSLIIFSTDSCQLPPDTTNTSCQANGSQFSVSSCPDDYTEYAAKMFGPNNPYTIEQAPYNYPYWNCRVQYVNAGSADAVCHTNPVDNTSFRSYIDAKGTILLIKYVDAACMIHHCGMFFYTFESFDWVTAYGPRGTLPLGKLNTVAVYEDNSCSAPATFMTFTNEESCTPQIDHYNPVCMEDDTVSDCTQYIAGGSDDIGIIDEAFGNYPHLIVEKYVWCDRVDMITDIKVYRLDENCYCNAAGTESHKLTLGQSINITTYTDANCVNVANQIIVDRRRILTGECVADDRKVILNSARPAFTFRAIYEDSTCSGTPSQLTFTPAYSCDPVQNENQPCESIGDSLFSFSGCTHDYSFFSSTAFGADTRFVMEELFLWECNNVGIVVMYLADNRCHADLDGSSSFQASINAVNPLVFNSFYEKGCIPWNTKNTAILTLNELISPRCMYDDCKFRDRLCAVVGDCDNWGMCSRKLSVGGQGSSLPVGNKLCMQTISVHLQQFW